MYKGLLFPMLEHKLTSSEIWCRDSQRALQGQQETGNIPLHCSVSSILQFEKRILEFFQETKLGRIFSVAMGTPNTSIGFWLNFDW